MHTCISTFADLGTVAVQLCLLGATADALMLFMRRKDDLVPIPAMLCRSDGKQAKEKEPEQESYEASTMWHAPEAAT